MVITLRVDGGFAFIPGLNATKTIDTALLPRAEAESLEKMLASTAFFALPSAVGLPPQGSADMQAFEITIEDGTRAHRVRVSEPVTDPGLEELLQFLQALPATGL